MLLHAYVDRLQLGAVGHPPLSVGATIQVTLVGNRGSTVGSTLRSLDCYIADEGRKALVRTGIAEYAFSGEILVARSKKLGKGLVYREALLDCGIPLIFAEHYSPGNVPRDLVHPSNKELSPGRYLSGLMLLHAHVVWSFRDPPLIKHHIEASIRSLSIVELTPSAETLAGLREQQTIDSASAILPAVVGIEMCTTPMKSH